MAKRLGLWRGVRVRVKVRVRVREKPPYESAKTAAGADPKGTKREKKVRVRFRVEIRHNEPYLLERHCSQGRGECRIRLCL